MNLTEPVENGRYINISPPNQGLVNQRVPMRLPRSLSTFETWGFGISGLLLWLQTGPTMHADLGPQAIFVWLPSVLVGILLNLQVKRLGAKWPDISGGSANYTTRLLKKYPALGRIAAIGYFVGWSSVPAINAIILTDLIQAGLTPLGIAFPDTLLKVGFAVLPFILAFSGTRALGILHLCFAIPAMGFLLAFCLQGLGWLAISPDSPGFVPSSWSSFSFPDWAKWYFIAVYATYDCETASSFVAESKRPATTLQCISFAAWLIPIVYLGASWLLMQLATSPELGENTFLNLLAAALPFWGESASELVTLLIVSSCLLSSATAVSNCPRILYQLSLDGYLAPVFSVVSRRGVLAPALTFNLLLCLSYLVWGDLNRILMVTGTGYLTFSILFHLGMWLGRRESEVRWPWLSLSFFLVEVVVLVVGGWAWNWQDLFLGLLLMPAIIVADAGVRHITFAFFHPTWWTRRRQAQSHQNPDFIILQVVIPIFLICSAITIGWGSKAFLAKLDPRSSEDLFVVLLVTVAFIGVAITGWTTLPQVAAIDQAREQSEHLFSVAVDPFLVLDEKGVICQANPAAGELFGAIAGSAQSAIATNLVGSSINNIFPALVGSPQDWSSRSEQTLIQRNQSTLSIEMAISARANWDIEEYVVILRDITKQKMAEEVLRNANDELETRVEGRTAELRNANEKLRSEITERKIAEEAMHQSEISFRLLFENNPHPMWVCLPETLSFIAVNNAAVRQYGYSIAEFTNMTLADICPPEDIPAYLEMLSKVSSELNVDSIWRHRKQDGTIVDVEITAHTLTFAGTQANVVLAHDVTERHRADTALRQTLAKEKELNQLKSNFINVASHEFRTPLTTILGTAELLEHYSYKYTEEKKLTFLKRIKSSVKQMNEVIDAVLVIAKNEAGKVDFNPLPIDLEQWCHHLLEEMQLIASNAHTINFISCAAEAGTTPTSIIAYMDEKLLRHIFSNLLSNAIKYSPSGGVIQFKLAIENESAIFQVTDSGIGIPPEDLQRLFDSFHRATNVGSIPGTGLGLTIVHNSVNIHGGTITVHSQVGKGTTFTVNLPLNYQSLA